MTHGQEIFHNKLKIKWTPPTQVQLNRILKDVGWYKYKHLRDVLPKQNYLCIYDEGLIGLAVYLTDEKHLLVLSDICVMTTHRRMGVGKLMIQELFKKYPSVNFKTVCSLDVYKKFWGKMEFGVERLISISKHGKKYIEFSNKFKSITIGEYKTQI